MTTTITSVGRRLASIEAGTGPGVLLLHSNGGSTLRYQRCLPALGQKLRAVAVDLPGFGDSRHLPGEGYTLEEFGEAIVAFSESHFGQAPVLLGHGIGGVVAVEAALAAPEAFRALLLHAPVGARLDRRFFPLLFRSRPANEVLRLALAAPALRHLWSQRFFAQPDALPPDTLDAFFEEYRRCRAFYRFFQLLHADWFTRVANLRLPTLLLWGARDRALSVHQLRDWVLAVPGAGSAIVPHWDHFPRLEAPDEYATRVTDLVMMLSQIRNT